MAIVDEYALAGTRPRGTTSCPRCGQSESDPSAMLGLVMLVLVNTFVVLAVAGAIAWLVV